MTNTGPILIYSLSRDNARTKNVRRRTAGMKTRPGLLGLILCCTIIFLISPIRLLAQERITSDLQINPKHQLTEKEKKSISLAAARMLRHVHQARLALKQQNLQSALDNVNKANTLARIVENSLPEIEVRAQISSGDHKYNETEVVKQWVIPIYAELDETGSVLFPVKRTKKDVAANETVGQIDLQYTSASLDFQEAKHYLTSATLDLQKNEAASADKNLAAVQDSVIFEYEETDLPLVRARWNLIEAARLAANKQYGEAKESLQKASNALESYAGKTGKEMSEKTKELAEEVRKLGNSLEEKSSGIGEKIQTFWDKVTNLF
jgi:hypothetical protein